MRKWQRWVTVSGAALLAAVGVGIAGAGQAGASDAKVPFTATALDRTFIFEGRVVRLSTNLGGSKRLSISRAVPGDLVALTDRSGQEFRAVVPAGGTTASTPWVDNAAQGRARTVTNREIKFPVA